MNDEMKSGNGGQTLMAAPSSDGGCCSQTVQETCCEPGQKADCCGAAQKTCGCTEGNGEATKLSEETAVKALKALADPTRLRIVRFLSLECCQEAAIDEDGGIQGPTAGEICCYITGAEKVTSTISHHLHELQGAGLIEINRKGKFMVCTLRREALDAVSDYLRMISKGDFTLEY